MPGVIHYAEPYGLITSVGFREGGEGPFVLVPDEDAEAFITGSRDVSQWTVDHDGRLISLASLTIPLETYEWKTIPTHGAAVSIDLRLNPAGFGELVFNAPHHEITLEGWNGCSIDLVFTLSDDPDAIVMSKSIPVEELNRHKRMLIEAPVGYYDIWSNVFDGLGYTVEIGDVSPLVPRGTKTMMRFEEEMRSACLHADIGQQVAFRLRGGGGPRYNAHHGEIMISFTRRGEIDSLLAHHCVDPGDIDGLILDKPEGEIDIWMTPMYCNLYVSHN